MIKIILFIFLIILPNRIGYSQSSITNNDIWIDYKFYTRSVPGFNFKNDGQHYTILEENAINEYSLLTGEMTKTIIRGEVIQGQGNFMGHISDYDLNNDESKILITSESETIYRRSTKSRYHVYDIYKNTVSPIFEKGKIMYATFSPDAEKVAFVFDNNLFYKNLSNGNITQITFDGNKNSIINGAADWVYEEEFMMSRAFHWSPDGDKIAFIKFDESKVQEYTMARYDNNLYPALETYKYPKVGEKNSEVSVHIYDSKIGKTHNINLDINSDFYIPQIKWTKDNNKLSVVTLNRLQNHLALFIADLKDQSVREIIEEKDTKYIDVSNHLTYLSNGEQFIWSSEKDGYRHLYLYDLNGNEIKDLTPGEYDIKEFYGVDPKRKLLYYQAAKDNPWDFQVYSVHLDGRYDKQLSHMPGTNTVQFASTFDYYILEHNSINEAPSFHVFDRANKLVRTIESNTHISEYQEDLNTQPFEFFSFTTPELVKLNGWILTPPQLKDGKEHPLLMFVYGGPGSQEVTDTWRGDNYWWFQMLVQKGYIVACVDNRGTGGRGASFKKSTYLKLGHYETIDQIEAARYLGKKDYVDASRIGIFGWSYGGFMATNCILKGNEVFKAAIAVAPVTNWKWYDSIYSERYMRTLEENEVGYRNNSPVSYAEKLSGKYLLIHGMADDNVHFQHTAELTNALIRANKQFDTYLYPNRNHGIYGENARMHLYTKMTNFILNNL